MEEDILTNTDLDGFPNNDWAKYSFCVRRKSRRPRTHIRIFLILKQSLSVTDHTHDDKKIRHSTVSVILWMVCSDNLNRTHILFDHRVLHGRNFMWSNRNKEKLSTTVFVSPSLSRCFWRDWRGEQCKIAMSPKRLALENTCCRRVELTCQQQQKLHQLGQDSSVLTVSQSSFWDKSIFNESRQILIG